MVKLWVVHGRHWLVKVVSVVVNCALPLDDRLIAGETLVVQGEREGQRDGGYRIIPVIADVGRAWHDAAAYLIYHVHANARRGR